MERFFVVVGRINSVLLLLVLLGVGAAFSFMMVQQALDRDPPERVALVAEKTAGAKAPVLLNLAQSEQIIGTDAAMILLKSEGHYSKVAPGQPSEIRNILFLRGREKNTSWLFKNHQSLILAAEQVQKFKSTEHPALALYVQFVANDSNGDGRLSAEDDSSIGLAKPDGSGFLPVVQGVSHVISYDMYDDDQLSLVYLRGTTIRHAKFSLARFKIDADKEILTVAATLD